MSLYKAMWALRPLPRQYYNRAMPYCERLVLHLTDLVHTQWSMMSNSIRIYLRAIRVVLANLGWWWELFWALVEELDEDL